MSKTPIIYSIQLSHHFQKFGLTSRGIHCTAITDDQAIPGTALTELEEGVFYLQHRA